jgi:hypothetical protein
MQPSYRGVDYWALTNRSALPRLFVPRRVETVVDDRERLAKLGSPQFQPREVAFVETPLPLPGIIEGAAEILHETPTHITAAVDLQTPGLVVLADHFDPGWQAYLNGRPTPLLRTDHALRGAVVPPGKWTLEFRYEPASITLSFAVAGVAAIILAGWALANRVAQRASAV